MRRRIPGVGFAFLLTAETFQHLRSLLDPVNECDTGLHRPFPGERAQEGPRRQPFGPVLPVDEHHGRRFAASIAPGPPPVATVSPARLSSRPRRAAPAYASVPRFIAWPPMTPTTRAPRRSSSRASEIESSWTARSIEAYMSPSALVRWNH